MTAACVSPEVSEVFFFFVCLFWLEAVDGIENSACLLVIRNHWSPLPHTHTPHHHHHHTSYSLLVSLDAIKLINGQHFAT